MEELKEYIESGILELYVYGVLSETENAEVYAMMQKYPEIEYEIQKIEKGLMQLSAAVAPHNPVSSYSQVKDKLDLNEKEKVIPLHNKKTNWTSYIGWAASIALLAGVLWQYNENKGLEQKIVTTQVEKEILETKITDTEEDLFNAKTLLSTLRSKNVSKIPLQAQEVDPTAYAAIYWDKENNTAYIDVEGLPTPPAGKVYQVWSLTLNPLTPTSLGTLDNFSTDKNKIFSLPNTNESQAFGITLEPEGGSTSPTMEQLYTLGMVNS